MLLSVLQFTGQSFITKMDLAEDVVGDKAGKA